MTLRKINKNMIDDELIKQVDDTAKALADKVDQAYVQEQIVNVNTGGTVDISSKADKSYVDSKISEIDSGGGLDTFITLAELQAKYPNGYNKPAWITSENSWYYWDGTYIPPDTTPPNDVSALKATNVTHNSATLSWVASGSSDIGTYEVYKDTIHIGSTTTTSFNVTGLESLKSYTFSVKSKDVSLNESFGVSLIVTTLKQAAISHLHLERVTSNAGGFVKTPPITFDEVIMDFVSYPTADGTQYYIDMRDGSTNGYVSRKTDGADSFSGTSAFANGFYLNDAKYLANAVSIPSEARNIMKLALSSAVTDDVNIMSQSDNRNTMTSDVYSVKFLNAGVTVAHYDMSTGTVLDQSGNGYHATLTNGTWIYA